jgi:NAD(P)-dependent dehydrogenase (short-subunit alcohol dehydrogenase family)
MSKQPRILAGETAAITGGARGIGRVTAEAMLGQGMRVAIGDVDAEAAAATAAELGPSAVGLALDVTASPSRHFSRASSVSSRRSTCSSTTPASCRSARSWTRTI